jgi:hypothetical protein
MKGYVAKVWNDASQMAKSNVNSAFVAIALRKHV